MANQGSKTGRRTRGRGGRRRKAPKPGSETERFRAIVDIRHNEAVTGESGVPAGERDHELRRQRDSLAEFS